MSMCWNCQMIPPGTRPRSPPTPILSFLHSRPKTGIAGGNIGPAAPRVQLKGEATSLAEYQSQLNMVATLSPVDQINLDRAVQLINKTNQFNLTTRRRNREEVIQLLAEDNVEMFLARLRDCFADHGIVVVAIGIQDGTSLEIDTLLMSCRVIGRDLERVVINEMIERARRRGCTEVRGWYLPTERNALVADLYSRAGFELMDSQANGATLWRRTVDRTNNQIDFITVERS
jgi:FkbH-like protein